ncbi:MAG: hypothetical protein ACYDEN_12945 [Acidimicrobiales bacterium]
MLFGLLASVLAALLPLAAGSDHPRGFWYGTDSTGMAVAGAAPYQEPGIGGAYGGYIGMVGDWALWQGCGHYALAWSGADAAAADTNLRRYRDGIGAAGYWFMGGPGVDPRYNGTVAEATAWGQQQAQRALADAAKLDLPSPVLWMDVELPGSTVFDPATDNGWNVVYTSACSGRATVHYISPAVDRAVLDGFTGWVRAHSTRRVGVYSAPSMWAGIFGTGSSSLLSGIYEWTAQPQTSGLARPPQAWCLSGTSTCARWFGGLSAASPYAAPWLWCGGDTTLNGFGDFDQLDARRLP